MITGDDFYVDTHFDPDEKAVVATDPAVVKTPADAKSLLAILRRSHRGKVELSADPPGPEVTTPDTGFDSAVAAVRVIRGPRSAVDAAVYIGMALAKRWTVRQAEIWERDESSRSSCHSPTRSHGTAMTETTSAKRMSPSVARGLPLTRKLDEGLQLFKLYRREARSGVNFDGLFEEIEEYDAMCRQLAGVTLAEAVAFEIGFGARPHRQIVLQSMGIDVRGVDAEAPVVPGRPSQFVSMLRRNGAERAAKSLIRHVLFDRSEQRALERALLQRGLAPRLDPARLIVADARFVKIEPGSLDLVISEDVFEHLQRDTLEHVVEAMARWLRPTGIALIRPNVFTGITGGHLIEWSRRAMRQRPRERHSEPWEHLRQRRFKPNTYLNELTRAAYRELFAVHFEILEERVTQPDLGRIYLDERAREELADWSDDELFSNQTLFVLRPRTG